MQLFRDIIFTLSTYGWEKALEEENDLQAVDRIVERFTVPLESAGSNTAEIHAEVVEIMQYASQYFSLSTMDYRSVWWRLLHAFNASEWGNALLLVQLLFSLPASNGKLERVFSTVNVIKVDKRATLSNESLDDLLVLNADKIPIEDFTPNHSIDRWWESKTRRPRQRPRKKYAKRMQSSGNASSSTDSTATLTPITTTATSTSGSDEESDSEGPQTILDKWDNWMQEPEISSDPESD